MVDDTFSEVEWMVPGREAVHDVTAAAQELATSPEELVAMTRPRRPSLGLEAGTLRLTLRTLVYVDDVDAVETGQLDLLVGNRTVVAAHRPATGSCVRTLPRLTTDGPAALAPLCRWVVEGYEDVCAELFVDIEEVEKSVFSSVPTSDAQRIYTLKREVAEVRRAVAPMVAPLEQLTRLDSRPEPDLEAALHELGERLHRLQEAVDTLDALLSSAFDAHVARISMQQNEDMRKISAAAALVVVPTLVAGIYGMNFTHMPELGWTFGYPVALGFMGLVVTGLYVAFKRSGWL